MKASHVLHVIVINSLKSLLRIMNDIIRIISERKYKADETKGFLNGSVKYNIVTKWRGAHSYQLELVGGFL